MTVRISKCDLTVLGTGEALPGRPISIPELIDGLGKLGIKRARFCGAIAERMGVFNRHFCREGAGAVEALSSGATNPELSADALKQAITEAGVEANDLQYLLTHTATPHTTLPPNASWLVDLLAFEGPYAELRQACTGFANALTLAIHMLASQPNAPVAIVGSETGSVYMDARTIDRNPDQLVNAAQMGDGAGAVVLAPRNGKSGSHIPLVYYGTLGCGKKPGLSLRVGGSMQPYDDTGFYHDFDHVKNSGPELIRRGLEVAIEAGIDLTAIDWFIPHQANGRMGEVLAPLLGIPQEKFFVCADRIGNTGSASIWMAFHELRNSGMLNPGDKVFVLGAEATKFMLGGFLYVH